jgi:hypothetical protein
MGQPAIHAAELLDRVDVLDVLDLADLVRAAGF